MPDGNVTRQPNSGNRSVPSFADWHAKATALKLNRRGKALVGPCPVCHGEDRFSVENHGGKALFQCRGCDPHGRDQSGRDAFKAILEAAGFSDQSTPTTPRKRRQASKASPLEPASPTGSLNDPFPRKDAITLSLILAEEKIDFRWNLRAQIIECREPGVTAEKGAWTAVDDRFMSRVRDDISRCYYVMTERGPRPLHYGRDRWEDTLGALLHWHEVDPFTEYLESLPPWNGNQVIETILSSLFKAPDDELSRWAGRFLFLGACQRTYQPGAKLDEIPVLVGPGGIGKSAFLRSMIPPEMGHMFSDGLRFDAFPEKQLEVVRGRVVVEVSEMAGRSRADIESMKAFVSRQDDGHVRRPYARHTEPQPRRFIMCGTTNNPNDLPNDPAGNRRFVPIVLGSAAMSVEAYLGAIRETCWAEGLHLYHRGETAQLPRALMPLQAERAEEHRDADDVIEDAVEALPNTPLTLSEVIELLPVGLRTMSEHRIGRALKNAGWSMTRGRSDGKIKRLWQVQGRN